MQALHCSRSVGEAVELIPASLGARMDQEVEFAPDFEAVALGRVQIDVARCSGQVDIKERPQVVAKDTGSLFEVRLEAPHHGLRDRVRALLLRTSQQGAYLWQLADEVAPHEHLPCVSSLQTNIASPRSIVWTKRLLVTRVRTSFLLLN